MKRVAATLLPILVIGSLACKKSEPPPPPAPTAAPATPPAPVGVNSVALGNAIGADKRVTAVVEAFGAKDTIYAVVETDGTGHAKLRALWWFVKGDKTAKVDETAIEFDSTAPTVNEFHISKPSGWPKGQYKVEIFLNEGAAPAATKTFSVG